MGGVAVKSTFIACQGGYYEKSGQIGCDYQFSGGWVIGSDWYRDRADECDRKAVATRNPTARARHIKELDDWRAIADNLDAKEKVAKTKIA